MELRLTKWTPVTPEDWSCLRWKLIYWGAPEGPVLIRTSHSVSQSGVLDRPARALDKIYTSDKNTAEEFLLLLSWLCVKKPPRKRLICEPSPPSGNFLDPLKDLIEHKDDANQTVAKFSLRKPSHPDDDLCYIVPGKPDSLAACTFNSSSKTFLVIHGWTVSRDSSACCDLSVSWNSHRLVVPLTLLWFWKEKKTPVTGSVSLFHQILVPLNLSIFTQPTFFASTNM